MPKPPAGFFMARTAIEDLNRTMTQMFGDGKGFVPAGAYLDCMQIHNLTDMRAVDQIYEGLAERGSSTKPERFGALADPTSKTIYITTDEHNTVIVFRVK
jgi:hypothetical protein